MSYIGYKFLLLADLSPFLYVLPAVEAFWVILDWATVQMLWLVSVSQPEMMKTNRYTLKLDCLGPKTMTLERAGPLPNL